MLLQDIGYSRVDWVESVDAVNLCVMFQFPSSECHGNSYETLQSVGRVTPSDQPCDDHDSSDKKKKKTKKKPKGFFFRKKKHKV